jgi:hypothetical protein
MGMVDALSRTRHHEDADEKFYATPTPLPDEKTMSQLFTGFNP